MEIYKLNPLSICSTFSFIAYDSRGNAVLIDAPDNAEYILSVLEKKNLSLKKILLTHGHFDHVGAVADLVDATGCEVYIHELDLPKLTDTRKMLGGDFGVYGLRTYDRGIPVKDGDIITQDDMEFKVLHTPGHTSGSACYICGDVMFSGDTLFMGSMGRTDMPDGDERKMMDSLRRLNGLDGDYRVLSGHTPETTLDRERRENYYMMKAAGGAVIL